MTYDSHFQCLVGPEVVAEATKVLETVAASVTDIELKLEAHDFGGIAIDKYGDPLPASTLVACQEADAILMGEHHHHTFLIHSHL